MSGRKRDCICCFIWGSVPPSLVLSPALSSDRSMTSCVNRCEKKKKNTVSLCSVDDCLLHCTASQGYGRGFIFCICHYDLCVVCNVKQTNKQANKQQKKRFIISDSNVALCCRLQKGSEQFCPVKITADVCESKSMVHFKREALTYTTLLRQLKIARHAHN